MQTLTYSSMACARRCLRQYYYSHELRLRATRNAAALRIGSAIHDGLALLAEGVVPSAAINAMILGYDESPDSDPYEQVIVATLIAGYAWRYGNDDLEYVEIEEPWAMPLVNPDTGRASRTWGLAGKRDGIATNGAGRTFVVEHKTCSEDLGPDSDYWLRLRNDQQISLYVLAALHQGLAVEGVIYDVIRKPTIRPRQIPLLDDDGFKVVFDDDTAERILLKSGKPRQSAGEGMTLQARVETPEEYGARLLADIEERPDFYYARREVPRLDDDLETCALECWQQAKMLTDCQRHGRWFRSVGRNTCSFCDYAAICLQSLTVDPDSPPAGFEIIVDPHPELSQEDNADAES